MVRRLEAEGFGSIVTAARDELDLEDAAQVGRFFDKVRPTYVVLAAGRVGGIVENQTYPADFMEQNLAIQLNVFRSARAAGVRKLVFFGSSCMYPRECEQPMSEDRILTGAPEPTSLPYALSKLAGTQMCLAYNRQLGEKRFLPVIPNSAYGPNDNFDTGSAHVLSALIARFHEARVRGAGTVTLWGTGTPRREFVHADDIADACLHLLESDVEQLVFPLNIGVGQDMSIRELADAVASVAGFQGEIRWDTSKPDGAPRKLLDSRRIRETGWAPKTNFHDGLRRTYEWYVRSGKAD